MMVWKFFTLFPPSQIQLPFPSQVARTGQGGRNLLSIFMVQARPPDKLNFSISGAHSRIYTLLLGSLPFESKILQGLNLPFKLKEKLGLT